MTWIVHIISAIMKGRLSSSTAECQVRRSFFFAVCGGGLLRNTRIEHSLECLGRLPDHSLQGLGKVLDSIDSPTMVREETRQA
jgi:hypothetical protein